MAATNGAARAAIVIAAVVVESGHRARRPVPVGKGSHKGLVRQDRIASRVLVLRVKNRAHARHGRSTALVRRGRSSHHAVIAHPTPVRGPGVDVIAIAVVATVADPVPTVHKAVMEVVLLPRLRREAFFGDDQGPRWSVAVREAVLLPRLRREAFFVGDHGPRWSVAVRA